MRLLQHILFLICLTSVTYGQQLDQIVLHDDSQHTGQVIEQKPGVYIKLLEESTNDTLTFEMTEIQHLKKVNKPSEKPSTDVKDIELPIHNPISPFLRVGRGGGDVSFVSLGIGFHYELTRDFSLGLSVQYLGETSNETTPVQWQKVPVALDARLNLASFPKSRSKFYMHSEIGYSFTLNGEFSRQSVPGYQVTNGMYISPGFGYEIDLFKNVGAFVELSYMYTNEKVLFEDRIIERNNRDNVMISAGIKF